MPNNRPISARYSVRQDGTIQYQISESVDTNSTNPCDYPSLFSINPTLGNNTCGFNGSLDGSTSCDSFAALKTCLQNACNNNCPQACQEELTGGSVPCFNTNPGIQTHTGIPHIDPIGCLDLFGVGYWLCPTNTTTTTTTPPVIIDPSLNVIAPNSITVYVDNEDYSLDWRIIKDCGESSGFVISLSDNKYEIIDMNIAYHDPNNTVFVSSSISGVSITGLRPSPPNQPAILSLSIDIREEGTDKTVTKNHSINIIVLPCPEESAACCTNGTCVDKTQSACTTGGGRWYPGKVCEDLKSDSSFVDVPPCISCCANSDIETHIALEDGDDVIKYECACQPGYLFKECVNSDCLLNNGPSGVPTAGVCVSVGIFTALQKPVGDSTRLVWNNNTCLAECPPGKTCPNNLPLIVSEAGCLCDCPGTQPNGMSAGTWDLYDPLCQTKNSARDFTDSDDNNLYVTEAFYNSRSAPPPSYRPDGTWPLGLEPCKCYCDIQRRSSMSGISPLEYCTNLVGNDGQYAGVDIAVASVSYDETRCRCVLPRQTGACCEVTPATGVGQCRSTSVAIGCSGQYYPGQNCSQVSCPSIGCEGGCPGVIEDQSLGIGYLASCCFGRIAQQVDGSYIGHPGECYNINCQLCQEVNVLGVGLINQVITKPECIDCCKDSVGACCPRPCTSCTDGKSLCCEEGQICVNGQCFSPITTTTTTTTTTSTTTTPSPTIDCWKCVMTGLGMACGFVQFNRTSNTNNEENLFEDCASFGAYESLNECNLATNECATTPPPVETYVCVL